ncbi:hypothetical protein D3C78_773720 [compost metagenome]
MRFRLYSFCLNIHKQLCERKASGGSNTYRYRINKQTYHLLNTLYLRGAPGDNRAKYNIRGHVVFAQQHGPNRLEQAVQRCSTASGHTCKLKSRTGIKNKLLLRLAIFLAGIAGYFPGQSRLLLIVFQKLFPIAE